MGDRELYATTISSVIDYFGGFETVARILNVSIADLELWASGRARPPIQVFRRIIDLREFEGSSANDDSFDDLGIYPRP